MLSSFYACGTEPTSQALVISWCSLLNRLSPPCFHTSAGIPPPTRCFVVAHGSVHSILLQLSCYHRRSPFHLLISGEQVPFSWVPTLPSVHCRSHSCRFCQQLSAAPLPSFPTSLYSVHGCIFLAVCRHLCML